MKKLLYAIVVFQILSCSNTVKENESIIIFDDSVLNIINKTSKIEYIIDSINLTEGPLWDNNSSSLLFTEIPKNTIHRWNEINGLNTYITPSGYTNYAPVISNIGLMGANGLSFDKDGDIILAQHGDRRLSRLKNIPTNEPDFETIVDNFEGKRFNSPNDMTISSNGDIYFTDPT